MRGATQTRRLPGASQFPWKQIGLGILAAVLVVVIAVLAINAATNIFSEQNAPAVQPEQQINTVVNSVPVVNPPAQNTEPEIVAPANPVVRPLIQVEWSEPRLTNPLNAVYTTDGERGIEGEGARFNTAIKLLPELKGLSDERVGIRVTIARDKERPEVLLLGISVADLRQALQAMKEGKPTKGTALFWARLFLSADGEKTWHEISLLKAEDDIPALAVSESGGIVHLSVRENTVQEMWREATLSLESLP